MIHITFVSHTGEERTVEAQDGDNVMEVAVDNEVPGIDADCGGSCACATCHVYVDESQLDRIGERNEMEQTMLDQAENVKPNSRLSCQLEVFEGLRVTIPEEQF